MCTAERVWPAYVWYPLDVSACPRVSFLHNLSKYALARLVQQQGLTREVRDELRRVGMVERHDAQTLANDRCIGRLKADSPPEMGVVKPAAAVGASQQRCSQ